MNKGFSLLEILIVLTLFAVLAIVSSQVIILTLVGSRKSEVISDVRENVEFAIITMERQLHNASEIAATDCTSSPVSAINFKDGNGADNLFSCVDIGSNGYIASSSGLIRLTNEDVAVTKCEFICEPGSGGVLPLVTISITAESANTKGAKGSRITSSTKIFLRTY